MDAEEVSKIVIKEVLLHDPSIQEPGHLPLPPPPRGWRVITSIQAIIYGKRDGPDWIPDSFSGSFGTILMTKRKKKYLHTALEVTPEYSLKIFSQGWCLSIRIR